MTPWPCILIVEDEGDQVAEMRECLRRRFPNGFVACVATGRQAEATDLKRFNLILLGYHLPDCTGLELVKRLIPKVSVPVVMVTGLRSGQTASAAIYAGAADYIVKTEDYLDVLPVVVEKNLVMASLRANVAELQEELQRRCHELREKNAELEARNVELREVALRDPLTGLFNRRYVNEAGDQLVSRAIRYSEDLACMMIDLDRFKQANDQLGHLVGDQLLQLAGRVISESVRDSDVAARFGGDEFMILLPRTGFVEAHACASRIHERFAQAVAAEVPAAAGMTLSIGVASLGENGLRDARELVGMADRLMYVCKGAGVGGTFPTPRAVAQTR